MLEAHALQVWCMLWLCPLRASASVVVVVLATAAVAAAHFSAFATAAPVYLFQQHPVAFAEAAQLAWWFSSASCCGSCKLL